MTRKRKAPVPASPPPPQPEIPWPDWLAQRRRALHVAWGTQGLRRIGECDYWLPPMQRPVVWTREQQLTYVRTLWTGMPCAPIILWDSYRVDGVHRMWILDGQQRLTAIGAHIRTADGTLRPPTRFCFDPVDGRWLDDPGQPGQSLMRRPSSAWTCTGIWCSLAGHAQLERSRKGSRSPSPGSTAPRPIWWTPSPRSPGRVFHGPPQTWTRYRPAFEDGRRKPSYQRSTRRRLT